MTKGRPLKLSEAQVEELQRRVAAGETVRALAKEFKVSPALISSKCSTKGLRLRTIAKAKVTVDRIIEHLPVSEQAAVISLMDQMKGISGGLMRVAELNGKTATLIAEKGHKKAQQLGPDPDIEDLREIAAFAETGNKLTSLGVSLMNNHKPGGDDPEEMTLGELLAQAKGQNIAEDIRRARPRIANGESPQPEDTPETLPLPGTPAWRNQ